MYIVVVGAGKLGYYLTKDLLSKGHEVTLVDWNHSRVRLLEAELGEAVLYASGSSIDGLEKAGCGRAEVIVAVTGDDEDNLVICQLGKKYFKVPKAISRINNPKNENVFKELGVGTTISGTLSIAEAIESYLLKKRFKTLLSFNQNETELIEIDITTDSPSNQKDIYTLNLPKNSIIALVLKGKDVVFPRGDTKIEAGDMILAIASSIDKERVIEIFQGTGE
ncbi:MAG: TrkA family potassium uptake protein [Vallitaleaceae bacterium]|nr:TrkA family potassium uptake protein [Vallitaleaceae bacterium]